MMGKRDNDITWSVVPSLAAGEYQIVGNKNDGAGCLYTVTPDGNCDLGEDSDVIEDAPCWEWPEPPQRLIQEAQELAVASLDEQREVEREEQEREDDAGSA